MRRRVAFWQGARQGFVLGNLVAAPPTALIFGALAIRRNSGADGVAALLLVVGWVLAYSTWRQERRRRCPWRDEGDFDEY